MFLAIEGIFEIAMLFVNMETSRVLFFKSGLMVSTFRK